MATNPKRQVKTSLSGPYPGSFPSRGTSPGRSSGRSRSRSPGRGSTSSRGTSPGSQRRRGSSDSSHSSRRDSARRQNGAQSKTAENGGVQSRRERPQRRRSLPKKEKEVEKPKTPIPINPELGLVEMTEPPQRNWKDIVHESSASDADASSLDSVNLGQINPSFDPGGEQPISRINYKSMGVHFNDDKNTEHPIFYQSAPDLNADSKKKPKSNVRKEKVVVKKQDGSKVIVVPNRHRRLEVERPVKERDLTLLTVFSIVSIFLFFPTGIPAVVYANKTRDEFQAGIQSGDLTKATKCAKKAERLIICSLVAGLLTGVLIFAVVEATRAN